MFRKTYGRREVRPIRQPRPCGLPLDQRIPGGGGDTSHHP